MPSSLSELCTQVSVWVGPIEDKGGSQCLSLGPRQTAGGGGPSFREPGWIFWMCVDVDTALPEKHLMLWTFVFFDRGRHKNAYEFTDSESIIL